MSEIAKIAQLCTKRPGKHEWQLLVFSALCVKRPGKHE